MDLFLLGERLQRVQVFDQYESLIWTERYKEIGDFSLTIRDSRVSRAALISGVRVAINESNRVMTIETVESTVSDDGIAMLKVSGRSLETLFEDRTARDVQNSLTTNPQWEITGKTPTDLVRYIFDQICVTGILSTNDKLDFYQSGSFYPSNNIAEPADPIDVALDPDSLYNVFKSIADTYNFGFRLVLGGTDRANPKLYFNVYTGDTRTSSQSTYPAVIFSPDLDNLSGTSNLTSSASEKNVAYVYSKNGAMEVLANDDLPAPVGLARRVLTVKADDITLSAGTALNAALALRGKQELAKNRVVIGFDGEIAQDGEYEYEKHYFLGDMVETRSKDGLATAMRVTEQIFACDNQGKRSYPTLTLDTIYEPGSWLGWDANQEWEDAGTLTWAEA